MTGWMYGDLESWNDGKLEMKGCIGEWLQDAWLHEYMKIVCLKV